MNITIVNVGSVDCETAQRNASQYEGYSDACCKLLWTIGPGLDVDGTNRMGVRSSPHTRLLSDYCRDGDEGCVVGYNGGRYPGSTGCGRYATYFYAPNPAVLDRRGAVNGFSVLYDTHLTINLWSAASATPHHPVSWSSWSSVTLIRTVAVITVRSMCIPQGHPAKETFNCVFVLDTVQRGY